MGVSVGLLTKRYLSSRVRTMMRRVRHPGHKLKEALTLRLVHVPPE